MHVTSVAHVFLRGPTGPDGPALLLLFVLPAALAISLPSVGCFLGVRGRKPIIWRFFIYLLAILIGIPAGAAGGYATMLGLDYLLRLGPGKPVLFVFMSCLLGLFIGGGLVPFGIARLFTKPKVN